MKKIFATNIALFCIVLCSYGQYEITFSLSNTLGLKHVGYRLDSSGFFAGDYVWNQSIFGPIRAKYVTIQIEYKDLDPVTLQRIYALIQNNDFFSKDSYFPLNKDYFFYETSSMFNPNTFKLTNQKDNTTVTIIDYDFGSDDWSDKRRYLISELQFLLVSLVPKKHEKLKFYPGLYELIRNSNQTSSK